MRRILSIYYKPKPGGFCKRLYMAYEAFVEKGWEVHYLSMEKFPLNHDKIHFHRIPMIFKEHENFLFWINFFVMSLFYMFYINLKISSDLIVVFGPDYSFISFLTKLFKKNKLALFSRGDQSQSLKETEKGIKRYISLFIYRVFSSVGFKLSDIIIFNSGHMYEKVKNKPSLKNKKIYILPNNIMTSPMKNRKEALEKIKDEFHADDDSFLLITVGRLHPGKNLEFLLKIFSRINELLKKENISLFIIGDDPLTGEKERRKLKSIIKDLGLNNVIFTGWRKDVDIFYASADVFIITSKYEGAPNSLLDAIGYNIPSFGSNIPEIKEILRNDNLLFSLDEKGIEKAASSVVKIYNDKNFLIYIKSVISDIKKRFSFDWKTRLCNVIDNGLQ